MKPIRKILLGSVILVGLALVVSSCLTDGSRRTGVYYGPQRIPGSTTIRGWTATAGTASREARRPRRSLHSSAAGSAVILDHGETRGPAMDACRRAVGNDEA